MSRAYLSGAVHDATERKYTYRLSQKSPVYVESIRFLVEGLGFNAWTYREGKTRDLYVVEFSKQILDGLNIGTSKDKCDYARGYFDSDGAVPKSSNVYPYIYFAQSDLTDLEQLQGYLEELNIETGTVHQPSATKAPDYWRFYVSKRSHNRFIDVIGSWHPRKRKLLREMRRSTPRRESGIT